MMMVDERKTCQELFQSMEDRDVNRHLAVQICESKLAKAVFGDKGTLNVFKGKVIIIIIQLVDYNKNKPHKVEVQTKTMDIRQNMLVQALTEILDNIEPLTTVQEYNGLVKRVMSRVYRDILMPVLVDSGFGGFMNNEHKITPTGLHDVQMILSTLESISEADFHRTASELFRVNGQLERLTQGAEWFQISRTYNLKNRILADDLDYLPLGQKYKMCTSTLVIWDMTCGVRPDPVEVLSPNTGRTIHDRIVRHPASEFVSDWLKPQTFELEINTICRYAFKMTEEVFFVINHFAKRHADKYDRKGELKEGYVMPDHFLINFTSEMGKMKLFDQAKEDSEIRGLLNCCELHRLTDEIIGMVCNAIYETYYDTEKIVDEYRKEYLFFKKSGAMGIKGDAGKAVGNGLSVITGKGKGSSERAKCLSDYYRGRVGSIVFAITSLVDKRPIPPGPLGRRNFLKNALVKTGVDLLKKVEDYEVQVLALKTKDRDLGDEHHIGKITKNFIVACEIYLIDNIHFLPIKQPSLSDHIL